MARRQRDPARSDWSRRGFLRSTAAAAGGLALGAPRIVSAQTRKIDPLNIAVIGPGEQGKVLIKDGLKIGGVRFKAVCDIWARNRRYAGKLLGKYEHRVNEYADYQEMLAKETDLDAVIVASPDWVHRDHTVACLEAGLHVYCEKEMSNDINQARDMVLAARKAGKRLQIGHQRRSNRRYYAALDYIDNRGVCGRVTYVFAQWNRGRHLTRAVNPKFAMEKPLLAKYGYGTMERLRNWRYYRKFSGGTVADLGSHQIDVLNWFLHALPKAVMANGGADNCQRLEWYDSIVALYEWDYELDGERRTVRGHYQACSTSGHGSYAETFMGPEGSITISEHEKLGCIRREPDAPKPDWEERLEDYRHRVAAEQASRAKDRGQPAAAGRGAGRCNCMIGPTIPEVPIRHYPPVPPAKVPTTEHMPHLENFFAAIRDSRVRLNCPGEVGYQTAVSVLRANEAVEAGRRLTFQPEDFTV
jgi:predicted dehydrogenase